VLSPAQVRAKEWWIGRLALHRAWRVTRGAGVTVAVLDTGVDGHFGDLRGALVPGFVPNGSGDGWRDTDPQHHGTIIADEIAGRGTGFGLLGVAPRARILPVTTGAPQRLLATDPTVLALDRLAAMSHPPQVANMSYGTAGRCPSAVQRAVRRAVQRGIILVAAAGNTASYLNQPEYPADCSGVVAVGAVNVDGHTWNNSQRQPYVSLAGPGVHMISYDTAAASGFGYSTGTSNAAAIVSGVFALVRAKFPRESAREVVTRVFATARQFVGRHGARNTQLGFGVALPYDALTSAAPQSFPNPVYAAFDRSPPATGTVIASRSPSRNTSSRSPTRQAAGGSTPGTAAIAGIAAGALVMLALAAAVLARRRRRLAR
jgi:subtilisin family serine protease